MTSAAAHTTPLEAGNATEDVHEEAISPTETDSSNDKSGSASPVDTALNSDLRKEPAITEARTHSFDGSVISTGQEQGTGRPWKTTFLRYGPLAGVACMLIAAGSIIVSLGVLIGSDHAPVAEWGATPSAILAICTAVANQSLRFAAFQGFVVAWWYNASRGTTLRQLHVHWRAGTTFAGALLAGRNMGLIGLACIFSTFVAIDGPLLQKATSVVSVPITNHLVTLNVSMSPEVPSGFTGGWVRTNVTQLKFSPLFNDTIPTANGDIANNIFAYFKSDVQASSYNKAWFDGDTIPGIVQGCDDGVCKLTVKAPALTETTCTTREIPVNYSAPGSIAGMQSSKVAVPINQIGFMVTGGLLLGDHERLNLITAYSDVDDCAGTLRMQICTLEPAIGEYNVTVDHGKLILGKEAPRIIALANNTQVDHSWNQVQGYHPSMLGGIASFFFIRFAASVQWFLYKGTVGGLMNGNGGPTAFSIPNNQPCQSFNNPGPSMLQALNELMFNVGAVAAREDKSYLESHLDSGLSVNTTATGYLTGQQNIFHTNLHWFAAAAAVEALCIALILPTYFGFWRLGRRVSFSPLEVSKAFEAPMFMHYNSNSSGKDIAKAVGDTQVQYGATRSLLGETKLAFASTSFIEHPVKGSRFEI